MLTIHKYVLEEDGMGQKIRMPKNAQLLHVDNQYNNVTVWALVDPTEEETYFTFNVVGTGWSLNFEEEGFENYLGTVLIGNYVWHVFFDYPQM